MTSPVLSDYHPCISTFNCTGLPPLKENLYKFSSREQSSSNFLIGIFVFNEPDFLILFYFFLVPLSSYRVKLLQSLPAQLYPALSISN